jgi:peptidoglycan glycosyltransferase
LHGDAGRTFTDVYWRDVLLNAPPPGRDVRLSIDLNLQKVADATLGNHTGAVVLLDTTTGEILALASHPTFDPNDLAAQWESLSADERAPLLNRATLALYQPGGALQPIVLAAALQAGYGDLTAPFASADAAVGIGDLTLGCLAPSGETSLTLAEAFQAGCPWPFAELGGQLGVETLNRLFQGFRLFEAPALPIPTTSASPALLASEAPMPALVRARVAAIGQGTLIITPLHLALVTAAIARHGEMPSPHLLVAAQNPEGVWEAIPSLSHPIAAIGPEYADAVKALMADGYSAIALTSTGGRTLAWFSGFAPFDDSRYAVAVLLEDGEVEAAREIGQELLRSAARISGRPATDEVTDVADDIRYIRYKIRCRRFA